MKVLAGLVVILIAALSWTAFTLNQTRSAMSAQQQSNEVVILDFSNRWDTTRRTLQEQKSVNVTLETNLNQRARQLDSLRVEIAGLNTDLAKSRAAIKTANEEIAKRDTQINSLESKNVDLTKQMGDLESSIANLEQKINETERKLATSEGNRQDLLGELKRLQGEKLSLEKQLNDLSFVRDQVRKLREELTIARRLDWIRRGLYSTTPKKGAETLATLTGTPLRPREATNATAPTGANPSLDVEIKRTGEVKITSTSTNPPPSPPAPAPAPARPQ